MSRKKARENAMSLVYMMEIQEDFSEKMVDLYFNSFEYEGIEYSYVRDAARKISKNLETIDGYIENNLKKWRIDRLAKVDLAVLRIAVYEILYRDDIPVEVAINEAIETVKKYSDQKSYKFINGVLGGIVKELERDDKEKED